MTEKRFTSVYDEQSKMMQYVDNQKEEPNKWAIWNANRTLQIMNELATKCSSLEKDNKDLKEENLELSQNILKGMMFEMIEETNDIEVCAEISIKRMFLLLMKAQELILENRNDKREILTLLSSVTHDVRMLDDKNNYISRDLYD